MLIHSTNDDIALDIEDTTIHIKEADDTIVLGNLTGSSETSRTSDVPPRCRISIDRRAFHLAASIAGQEEGDDDPKPGLGTLFCGSCCDLLRACILLDCLYIIKSINLSITDSIGLSFVHPMPNSFGDDDYDYEGSAATASGDAVRVGVATAGASPLYVLLITKNCLSILFGIISIVGATNFKKVMVGATAVWCCIDVALSSTNMRWLSTVVACLVLYPQIALFLAFHHGTITPKNYDTVRRCCCYRGSLFPCLQRKIQGESSGVQPPESAKVNSSMDCVEAQE